MGCEKVIVPLNLITESCCCQGQHNQAFVLIVNASLLCGGILVHSSLQNCFNSERSREFEYEHPVLSHSKASKSHVSPNFDRASSSFCLSLSEVDSLMCFGSLFYCITHVSLRFRTQTDGWTFSFRMFWYIKQTSWFHQLQQNVLKQQSSPDLHSTTTMYDCWYDGLFMKYCVTPHVTGLKPYKKFVSSVHRILSQKSCFLANVRRLFMCSDFLFGTFLQSLSDC